MTFSEKAVKDTLVALSQRNLDMAKLDEKAYPERIASVLGISQDEVHRHLREKPFRDPLRARYFVDFGQILSLLPPSGRILDLGVGTGWTSRFLAQCGYEVVGLDISETMIAYAREGSEAVPGLTFHAIDYEQPLNLGTFDAAIIYDALHHSEDERAVIQNVFDALKPDGIFVTAEPGAGHSTQPHSIDAMKHFGVTEKDMEFTRQRELMLACGFSEVHHYVRLTELTLVDLVPDGAMRQRWHVEGLIDNTIEAGITSIVVGVKKRVEKRGEQVKQENAQLENWIGERTTATEQIKSLSKLLKESEADRAARLEQIKTLDKLLKESEADRAARLEQIKTLNKLIGESESDRAARLEQIKTLNKSLKELDADRALQLENIRQSESSPAIRFSKILSRLSNKRPGKP